MWIRKLTCISLSLTSLAGCSGDSGGGGQNGVGGSSAWDGEPGRIWVTHFLRDTIGEIDAATGAEVGEYDMSAIGSEPADIAACGGSAWFNGYQVLGRITADKQALAVEPGADDIVCGNDGSLWGSDTLFVNRVDGKTGATLAQIQMEMMLYESIAFGAGSAWVFNSTKIYRIDPSTNQVAATIVLPASASVVSELAFGEGALWLLSHSTPSVLFKIDPGTNTVVTQKELPTADPTADVMAGFGSVWISSAWTVESETDDKVFEIDPVTIEVKKTHALPGAEPSVLELGGKFVYVKAYYATGAVSGEQRLYKIDPITGAIQFVTMDAKAAGTADITELAFEAK